VSEILILARVRINELDLPVVTDYYFDVKEKLAGVPGCYGLSVWRDEVDAEAFLVIYEYADLDAAERGLVALTEIRVLAETQAADFRPADVQRIRVGDFGGYRMSEVSPRADLSVSHRVADPGYGPELLAETEQIMTELALMPGYLGSVYGINDALEEEVLGLVAWSSREAFVASLPPHATMRTITVYSRFY